MDASWASVVLAIIGIIVTGVVAYQAALRGTAVALAVMEVRHGNMKEQVVYLTETKDDHAEKLADLDLRVSLIERGDRAPLDYVPR